MARRPSAKNEMQDSSLPEKQRARWRFIGATILALFAMILLPLALESEPRQAIGSIDVSIPKREDLGRRAQYWPDAAYRQTAIVADQGDQPGLFTRTDSTAPALDDNRFNPDGVAALQEKPQATAAVLAERSVKTVDADKPDTNPVSQKPATDKNSKPLKLAVAKPPAAELKAPPMPERRTDPNQIKAASPSGYVVQIGAFSSSKGARAQVKRAKALGFKAYTQRITTSKGVRIRVRIGPYLNRALANDVREKLRKKGIETALIAP
ncbi:MAG: SPOR domain-containing protein [Burkholderiaceae bacterium]